MFTGGLGNFHQFDGISRFPVCQQENRGRLGFRFADMLTTGIQPVVNNSIWKLPMSNSSKLYCLGSKGFLRSEALPVIRRAWRRLRHDVFNPIPPPKSCVQVRDWIESQTSRGHRVHEQAIESHPCFVAEISQGRVFGNYSVVISPDNFVLRDVSSQALADQNTHRACDEGALPPTTKVKGNLAVVASSGGEGYYHWLMESLHATSANIVRRPPDRTAEYSFQVSQESQAVTVIRVDCED